MKIPNSLNRFTYILASLAAMLCISPLLSCTTNIEPPPPPLPPSSSSLGEVGGGSSSSSIQNGESSSSNGVVTPEYGYCVFASDRMCLAGPVISCPPGGELSNVCPYRSSSSVVASSSSLGGSSSSVAVPSSGAAAPSSSGGCVSSGSYCYYGGCSQWSSDGWTCLPQGGCYPMPTEDNCRSGTLVSTCPAGAIPPAANYCELPPAGSPSSSSVPSSSSASLSGIGGTFTDSRDGKVYKKVTIGTQTWMAENLNYNASGSKCYANNADNCATYGRL